MALNTDPTGGLYSPSGVDFQDNLRIGSFSNKSLNTVGYGVPIGNVQAYSIKPQSFSSIFEPTNITNNSFLSLSNFQPGSGPTLIPNVGLKLDVPRLIQFVCNTAGATFSYRASYLDMYNQETVYNAVDQTTADVTYTSGGVNILTSIYFYNFSAGTLNFTINQTDHFELPYTDLGQSQRLQSITCDGQPQRFVITNAATPYGSRWGGNYFPASTNPINNVRPIFQVTGDNRPDGNKVLTFVQDLDRYGFKFNQDPYQDNNLTYPNNVTEVIGVTPDNTNWQGWMG